MLVHAEYRCGQLACECRYVQRAEVCSENISVETCREQMWAVNMPVLVHAESRHVQWAYTCRDNAENRM